MASNKKRLQGLIGRADDAEVPVVSAGLQRGTPFQISSHTPPVEPELPPQAGALSTSLQEIARRYIGARRRSGEALLEAARWLAEARAQAQYGEWQVFLDATSTSDDIAVRLLNIHAQAMQNPQFADAVSRNWLGQSAAALLARPSTPPEVVEDVLKADKPPKVAEIMRQIRQGRETVSPPEEEQIPQIAEFQVRKLPPSPEEEQIPQIAEFVEAASGAIAPLHGQVLRDDRALRLLQDVVAQVQELATIAHMLPDTPATEQALHLLELSIEAIRRAHVQHSDA